MPLTSGLVAWWPLSETSGTRVDVVGGKDLTDSGTTLGGNFNPEFNSGSFGGPCAVFGGTTALVRGNDSDFHVGSTSDFSVSVWFKVTTGGSSSQAVIGKYNNEAGGLNWVITAKVGNPGVSTDAIEFIAATSDSTRPSASFRNVALPKASQNDVDRNVQLDQNASLNRWYHMVGLRTASGITMGCLNNGGIANGAKLVTDPRIGPGQNTSVSRFGIGARVSSAGALGFSLIGSVCNAGIWNRLLTEAEIGQLWNGGNGLDYPFTGII